MMTAGQIPVLHLVDSFNTGGSETQAVQLARAQGASGGHQVHLACLDRRGPLLTELESIGITEIPEYPLTSFYDRSTITQVRRFGSYLRQHKIAILQTHDFYTNIFGMAAGAIARVPVRIAARRESAMRSGAKRSLERCAYRMAHAVVANCEEVRRQLIEEGVPARKIETIHNGLAATRFAVPKQDQTALLSSLGILTSPDIKVVSLVANLRLPVKDHGTFLRAAQRVRSAVANTAFVIAGEGELAESMRSLAGQLGLAECTHFLGRCDRVADLLAVTDVAVLSSVAEGFPNVVLEYMAAGCPVVSTDVGGVREAVVDGVSGYLVTAREFEAMAQRVIELLRDPERARAMGRRGRIIAQEQFSVEAQNRKVAALYERLLAGRGWDRRCRAAAAQSGCSAVTKSAAALTQGSVSSTKRG